MSQGSPQSSPKRLAIGVDVGGTKIAFALIDDQGHSLATHRLPTEAEHGSERVLTHVVAGIDHLLTLAPQPVVGIGIGSPGQVDPVSGCVRNAVNLGWERIDLRSEVSKRLQQDIPIHIEKDANAAALGEMYFGAARGSQDFVLIAIGTGLGGGAVIGGEVVSGGNANAMEIGHLGLELGGRLCRCGLRGCPEMYVSGVGMTAGIEVHREHYPDSPLARLNDVSTTNILEAARAGDSLALKVLDEAAHWLATVMVMCGALINPTLYVIGGGLGHAAAHYLMGPATASFKQRTLPATHENVRLVESQVKSSAVGAGCLVWHALRKSAQ
jgi:glucokinase